MSLLTVKNDLFPHIPHKSKPWSAKQYKIVTLREAPSNASQCDSEATVAAYYRDAIITDQRWTDDTETLVVVMLNVRRHVIGHHVISNGLVDQLLCHSREVFRAAIIANASSIVMIHNHPSGDPTPSEADIRATRDIYRAGQVIKIELTDHIIFGMPSETNPNGYVSLRGMGYLYQS